MYQAFSLNAPLRTFTILTMKMAIYLATLPPCKLAMGTVETEVPEIKESFIVIIFRYVILTHIHLIKLQSAIQVSKNRNQIMKLFFKYMTIVLALIAPSMLLASADPAKISEEMERLRRVEASLSSGGISELLKTASGESIPAPRINSKYYAERIAKQEPLLASLEQAKRALGLKVAQSLDGLAVESQQQTIADQRLKQATRFLDLADWFKTQKGYGNYLLVTRCENLAAVPLGYLTGDLAIPMEKITIQRKRISNNDEERTFRKSVLNSEAPKPFIGELTGTQSQQDEQMQIAWSNQWHAIADWFKARNVSISKWKQTDLPDEFAFFFEEDEIKPFTTTRNWEINRHSTLVNGFRDKNIENIDGFAKYRELVGKFPTEPPKWWKPDDRLYTKTKAAFEDAWRPYEEANGPIFGVAVIVYEQVTTGTLMDSDSLLEKLAAKKTP